MSDMGQGLARDLLTGADFELIPLKGVLEKAVHIETGSTVSVTASPAGQGLSGGAPSVGEADREPARSDFDDQASR